MVISPEFVADKCVSQLKSKYFAKRQPVSSRRSDLILYNCSGSLRPESIISLPFNKMIYCLQLLQ